MKCKAEKIIIKFFQKETLQGKTLNKLHIRKDDFDNIRAEPKLVFGDFKDNFIFPMVFPGNHHIVKKGLWKNISKIIMQVLKLLCVLSENITGF